jgi:hypothetical protein
MIHVIVQTSETQGRQFPDPNDTDSDASDVLEVRKSLHGMIETGICHSLKSDSTSSEHQVVKSRISRFSVSGRV